MTRLPRFSFPLAAAFAAALGWPGLTGALAQEQVTSGTGAVMRALDKASGKVTDLEIASGSAVHFGRIIISVEDCRFPTGNPAGNAFAHVTVWNGDGQGPALFNGWMVAGSPALNALDHPRYDTWVLRCTTS